MKKNILEKFRNNIIDQAALKSIIGGSYGCQYGNAPYVLCATQGCTLSGASYCCTGTTHCSH